MPTEVDTPLKISCVAGRLRSSWRSLLLTDVAFKAIAFTLLTPLAAISVRGLLTFSGVPVVSDMDILRALLSPAGAACAVVIGALWLGIVALEQSALLRILAAADSGRPLGPAAALRFAFSHAWPVVRVTLRMCALSLLAIAPFGAAAAFVYWRLLTKHDINFYLAERPPEFQIAIGLGAVIAVGLLALLLRLASSWFFALPLVLFELAPPTGVLRLSADRAGERRRLILAWIAGWFLATALLSAAATAVVGLVGRLLTPDTTTSLSFLAMMVGVTVLLLAAVNLAVNLVNTTAFATILFSLYRSCGGGRDAIAALADGPSSAESFVVRVTRLRALAAGAVGVIAAAGIGAASLVGVTVEDSVQVMAHRGSSQAAPENTMAAFRRAIEDGADWIELDVQETSDGEVVVLHDSDFMKLSNNPLKIWDAAFDDLRDIDTGGWFSPDFADERVPTLADVLDLCRGKIGVNIELKYYGHDQRLEQRVVDIVESRGMSGQVKVMSLKMQGVKKMKALRPDWQVGLLMSVSAGNLSEIDADFLAINAGFASRPLIRSAHQSGKEVYVWTVNDAPTMSAMISRGVDGLLTDNPSLARSVLAQRAEMSAPQRLLLELAGLLGAVPDIKAQ